MKRKIKVALGIHFGNPDYIGYFVRDSLKPWKSRKKCYVGYKRAYSFRLDRLRFTDNYYIDFNTLSFPITPYFLIKDVFYEEKKN